MRVHLDKDKGVAVLVFRTPDELMAACAVLCQHATHALQGQGAPYALGLNLGTRDHITVDEMQVIVDRVMSHGLGQAGDDGKSLVP